MMYGLRKLVCLVTGAAVCAQAAADVPDNEPSSDNPYQAIVERNVFGLRPPPPPPGPEEAPKPPPPPLTLTGITTMLGKKLAFLKSAPQPGKPGQPPPTEQFYTLAEGQQDGDLLVMQIDENVQTVKVNYAGTVSTLDFINNGAKEKAAPVMAAAGQPGQPGGIPAPPMGVAPGASVPAQGNPSRLSLPNRPVRLPAPGAAVTTQGSSGNPSQYGAFGGNVSQTTDTGNYTRTTSRPRMTAEEQAILIEVERERTRNAVAAGQMPPLPPTPLTQAVQPQPAPVQTPVQQPRPRPRPGMPIPLQ